MPRNSGKTEKTINISVDNENEIPTDEEAQMDPQFHVAFTGPPI